MAITPAESAQDQEDFAAAFNSDEISAPEQSEDEAFGLTPENGETEYEEAEVGPQAEANDAESAGAGMSGSVDGATEPSVTVAPDAMENGATDEMSEQDVQRAKSWEGRLKAREADLKAREDAISSRSEAGEKADPAQEAGEPAVAEAVESAAAMVESGEMSYDQAMSALSNDFGAEFTRMLGVLIDAKATDIASKTADERVTKVSQKLDGIVGEIVDDKARSHFESISDAHPDFIEIADSPEFKEYIDAMDETKKADAMMTIDSGSSRKIVKLLSDFKSGEKTEEGASPAQEQAMDAAEGVRSTGMKIPNKPAMSEDYESAWNQF